jgi:ion channel POLLUX/CASTOR
MSRLWLSEQSALSDVFTQLLGGNNAKVCLRRASDLVRPDTTVNFATIVESARRQGQIAIGYRHTRDTSSVAGFGVVLNPSLATEVVLGEGDQIVILTAERVEQSQAV